MNILHVIRTMDPAWGGPVEGVRNIAAQADAAGHKLEIVCLDSPKAHWLQFLKLHVHAVGPAVGGRFGYSRRLDSWLATNIARFDVVVTNGIWMYFSTAVRRAAMRANIPYFVFPHGALDPWFKRYRMKQVKKTVYWSLFEHKVMRDASAVLFTSAEEEALAYGAFKPYDCNSKVVGYGIRDPLLSRSQSEDPLSDRLQLKNAVPNLADRKFLLFLARLHEKKGIDLLLRAIARNQALYSEYALLIAGPGDGRYISELRGLTTQLGLDQQVIWTGPLYGEMKWAALREAEAYILPSHQENFGISVVESLACGVPVLITNKVNIWREIVDAGGGFAETDDVSGICRLLETWNSLSLEDRIDMRGRARECFLKCFDLAQTCSNLFGVLEQRHVALN